LIASRVEVYVVKEKLEDARNAINVKRIFARAVRESEVAVELAGLSFD
jgi:hypothetical protein